MGWRTRDKGSFDLCGAGNSLNLDTGKGGMEEDFDG